VTGAAPAPSQCSAAATSRAAGSIASADAEAAGAAVTGAAPAPSQCSAAATSRAAGSSASADAEAAGAAVTGAAPAPSQCSAAATSRAAGSSASADAEAAGAAVTGAAPAPSQCSAAATSRAAGSSASADADAAGAAAQDSKKRKPTSSLCEHKMKSGWSRERDKCKVFPALKCPELPVLRVRKTESPAKDARVARSTSAGTLRACSRPHAPSGGRSARPWELAGPRSATTTGCGPNARFSPP